MKGELGPLVWIGSLTGVKLAWVYRYQEFDMGL
jgi:hypothetical protein